jgi:hypothetical protein
MVRDSGADDSNRPRGRLRTAQKCRGDVDEVEDSDEEYDEKKGGNESRNSTEGSPSSPSQETRRLGFFHGGTHHARADGKNPSINLSRARK